MSLKPLLSFSSGELDPILTDQVTLEKFNKGLSTARNVMIGKTGAILSRFSRKFLINAKDTNEPVKMYHPPNTDYLLEFGKEYVRVHVNIFNYQGIYEELVTPYTSEECLKLHFTTSKEFVYVFCEGKKIKQLELKGTTSAFLENWQVFLVPAPITFLTITPAGSPTGYKVDYLVTLVINGEETLSFDTEAGIPTGTSKPIASGQTNVILVKWPKAIVDMDEVSELRVYSRPNKGGAWGYLGSTTSFADDSDPLLKTATFTDIGSVPDYNNGTQDLVTKYGLKGSPVIDLKPTTGTVYQQRLITNTDDDKEAMIASRPGYKNNFFRDFPYASDSALLFKAGTSGKASVLRIIENEGLVVFTTNGVYTNVGILGPNNVGLERRGAWIIDVDIPPLLVPGGLFFVDQANTIRQMVFSQEILAYESVEQTIFSNHLFKTRKIKSWCYQTGTTPVIIVTFIDGTFATFTYNFEHQMRAWTRHDNSKYPIEQVEGSVVYDTSFFLINKNGKRQIEMTVPRYISAEDFSKDSEVDMKNIMFGDAIKLQADFVGSLGFVESLTLVPVNVDEWDGELKVTYSDQDLPGGTGPFSPPWVGGSSFVRWFHPIEKYAIDLEVISSLPTETIFQPSETFPSEYAKAPRLYIARPYVTGLTHLEGEKVSIIADGSIVSSPNNDVEGYPEVVVTGGTANLPDGLKASIILVGRPITADVKTLNVSTVEQSPTLIESINVNKMYVRVQESRCIYVANNFPEESLGKKDGATVFGMDSIDSELVPKNGDIIGNAYFPSKSKRCEVTMRGDWSNAGQVAFRQVDPYHFEILSIIPDLTVLSRSDR